MIQERIRFYDNYMPDDKRIPYGYSLKAFGYALNIDEDGNLLDIVSLVNVDKKEHGLEFVVPDNGKPESSGAVPRFLWGKMKYIFKVEGREKDFTYFEKQKQFHLSLLKKASEEGNKNAQAICRYFENAGISRFSKDEKKQYDAYLFTFRVNGMYLFDDKTLCVYWDAYMNEGKQGISAFTGEKGKLLEGPPPQFSSAIIKGTGSGSPLIFRKKDIDAYQMEMPLPQITQLDVHKYSSAFEYLMTRKEMRTREERKEKTDKKTGEKVVTTKTVEYPYFYHKNVIGDELTLMYWAESKTPLDMNPMFGRSDKAEDGLKADDLRDMLVRACCGLGFKVGEDNPVVHIYGLIGVTGRIRLVFSAHELAGDMINNATAHQKRMCLVGLKRIPSVFNIMDLIIADSEKTSYYNNVIKDLVMAIVLGTNYPERLYVAAIEKLKTGIISGDFKIGSYFGTNLVSLIKAVLIKNYKMEVSEKLDEWEMNTAYLLGRAYAAGWLYTDSKRRDNMTKVMERWYRPAQETPKMAYAPYFASARVYDLKDYKIAEIMKDIKEIPERLSLKEQGMWVLGFYHEYAKIFKIGEPKKDNGSNSADVSEKE